MGLFSEKLSGEHATEMENVKSLVHRLFTALHLEEFQKKREHHLLEEIDRLKGQLQPLEQVRLLLGAVPGGTFLNGLHSTRSLSSSQ